MSLSLPARINAAYLLVLACEENLASVPVPAGGQNQFWIIIWSLLVIIIIIIVTWQRECDKNLPGPHVPHADIVIAARAEQLILVINNKSADKVWTLDPDDYTIDGNQITFVRPMSSTGFNDTLNTFNFDGSDTYDLEDLS